VSLRYFAAAAPLLSAAVETAKRFAGRRDPSYTHALISVARCHMREQRPADARDAYKRLLAVQKHVLGPSHLLLATTTKVRPVDARDAYKRLLAVQKHVLGPSHLLLATTTKVRPVDARAARHHHQGETRRRTCCSPPPPR
jgi:hypothetical protein